MARDDFRPALDGTVYVLAPQDGMWIKVGKVLVCINHAPDGSTDICAFNSDPTDHGFLRPEVYEGETRVAYVSTTEDE